MRSLSLTIVAAAALAGTLEAQAPQGRLMERPAVVRLSLKQAVDAALAPEGNTRVQLAQEAIRQAQARSAQARAALLPNFDASFAAQNQTRNLAAFGLNVRLPIPGVSIPSFVGPFTTIDGRVTGSQSVFDFASIRRFQASRAGVRATEADTDSTRDQISARVASLYMNALAAQAHVEAAQADADLAAATAKLAENRKVAGTGTGIEVTRAQVELANAKQRLLVVQNDRKHAVLDLLREIGLRLDTEVELTDKLTYEPVAVLPLDKAVESALAARPDWKAQERRQQNARLNYSATKMERLPSLAGFGDYGSIGTGFNNSLPTRTYGVMLRVPIFDGGRRDARRSESASQMRQEQVRASDLREQVELEVRVAMDNLSSAEEQLKVADEGLALAEREVAQAQRRYEAGVANSLEPTDAQTRLARARENRISALLAYNVSRISLGQAMGTIRDMIR